MKEEIRGGGSEVLGKMAKLLMAPPTPCSNSRDYSKDDDSDSDVSEDSLGKVLFYFIQFVDPPILPALNASYCLSSTPTMALHLY